MSDDNVIFLNGVTRLDIPASRVLDAALEQDLKSVVVMGYDKEGNEYFASSIADGANVNWLMDRCKTALLAMEEE